MISLIVVFQLLSHVQLFAILWTAPCQASLSFTISRRLLKLMSIKSVMPSNHLILCRLLLFPPSIFPSIRVFSNESVLHIRWPKYWSSSFSISPSNEYSGVISFRMGWLDLLTVQGTLMSLLHPQARPFLPLPSPPCHVHLPQLVEGSDGKKEVQSRKPKQKSKLGPTGQIQCS